MNFILKKMYSLMILIKEHNISVTITVINTHIIKSDLKIFTFNRQCVATIESAQLSTNI